MLKPDAVLHDSEAYESENEVESENHPKSFIREKKTRPFSRVLRKLRFLRDYWELDADFFSHLDLVLKRSFPGSFFSNLHFSYVFMGTYPRQKSRKTSKMMEIFKKLKNLDFHHNFIRTTSEVHSVFGYLYAHLELDDEQGI